MVSASDPDSPPQTLTYKLLGAIPEGSSIDSATGLFQWRPALNAASHRFTVQASDSGSPASTAVSTFLVSVKPVTLQVSRFVPVLNRQRAITGVTVEFTQTLDTSSATRTANYLIVNAGRDGRFGTRDDRTVRVRSVRVSADRKSVVLSPQATLVRNQSYRLTVLDSVLDSLGRRLDGDRNGNFGGSASVNIIRGVIQ